MLVSGNSGSGDCLGILKAAAFFHYKITTIRAHIDVDTDCRKNALYVLGETSSLSWISMQILDNALIFCNNSDTATFTFCHIPS